VKLGAINVCVAVLLTWSLTAGTCAFCPVEQQRQPSKHDCCQPARPSDCGQSKPHDSKECPNRHFALENYSKVEADPLLATHAPVAIAMVQPAADVLPPASVHVREAISPLVHAPPDLYLLNSVFLI
jgi:hypothetical protein